MLVWDLPFKSWGGAARGVQILLFICTKTSSKPPTPRDCPSNAAPEPALAINSETREAAASTDAAEAPLLLSTESSLPPPSPLIAFWNSFLSLAIVAIVSGLRIEGVNRSGLPPSVVPVILRERADFPFREDDSFSDSCFSRSQSLRFPTSSRRTLVSFLANSTVSLSYFSRYDLCLQIISFFDDKNRNNCMRK
jgi:hypothetical protein